MPNDNVDSYKIVQDTVHGYLKIENKYFNSFVDTIYFQRLRRIEQTSMRSLYPCARHDRFAHSLGVFYLGTIAFDAVVKNSNKEIESIEESTLHCIKQSFYIACLMHDCGHAPFSHTFEYYFDLGGNLEARLKQNINNIEFDNDLDAAGGSTARPHEKMSAILLIEKFGQEIQEFGADALLITRMITGCLYETNKTNENKIKNCFINLLNGFLFDVDKLDYLLRDAWASGVASNSIDVDRILSSLCIRKHGKNFEICFKKNAVSSLQSILDARDFQLQWMHPHPKVVYYQWLLVSAVRKMSEKFKKAESSREGIYELFDISSFFGPILVGDYSLYLPSDDDIVYLLKCDIGTNEYCEEWLSRKHKLKPLWKSYSEFAQLSSSHTNEDKIAKGKIYRKSTRVVEEFLRSENRDEKNYYIINKEIKLSSNISNRMLIDFGNKIVPLDQLSISRSTEQIGNFFYLYIPSDLYLHRDDLIDKIF